MGKKKCHICGRTDEEAAKTLELPHIKELHRFRVAEEVKFHRKYDTFSDPPHMVIQTQIDVYLCLICRTILKTYARDESEKIVRASRKSMKEEFFGEPSKKVFTGDQYDHLITCRTCDDVMRVRTRDCEPPKMMFQAHPEESIKEN